MGAEAADDVDRRMLIVQVVEASDNGRGTVRGRSTREHAHTHTHGVRTSVHCDEARSACCSKVTEVRTRSESDLRKITVARENFSVSSLSTTPRPHHASE